MNKATTRFIEAYFNPALDLRGRLFHVLAMGGIGISLLVALLSVLNHADFVNIAFTLVSTILSYALLSYSRRSGRYQICYLVSIAAIFFVFFPLFFFTGDGYHGGMPAAFVFAVMFTIFMIEGKKRSSSPQPSGSSTSRYVLPRTFIRTRYRRFRPNRRF